MTEAVRVIRRASRAFYEELYLLFFLNILTALTLFLLIPFPPALVGLWAVARRVAEGRIIRFGDWWAGVRRYFWPAWRLALLNLVIVGVTLYNIRFYGPGGTFTVSPGLSAALQGTLGAALAFWLACQLYVLPLMVQEERPAVSRLLLQSVSLLVENAVFSLTLLVLISVLVALSTVVYGLGFFVTPAAIAVLTMVAARHLQGMDAEQNE
jgi:hypothetical protein